MRKNESNILYSESTCLTPDGSKYVDARGVKHDRVSQVIKTLEDEPFELNQWKARLGPLADIITAKTADIGTAIHAVTAFHDLKRWKERDKLLEAESKLVPYFLIWDAWVREYVKRIIAVEVVVFDAVFGIAGTIDRVFQMVGDKKATIGDIKTGGIGYKKIEIQVAGAYMTMWNENCKEWGRKDHIADRAIVIPLNRWKTEEEIRELGKEDKEIKDIRVKEVTSPWAQEKWQQMRADWLEMR